MPPSYPIKQLGFSDDRRRSGYESYRPPGRDRDPDRGIGDRCSLSRRDTDPRNYRDDRDRSRDGERNRPKPTENFELQLNTSIPTGPRIPSWSTRNSPLSSRGSGAPSFRASVPSKCPKYSKTTQSSTMLLNLADNTQLHSPELNTCLEFTTPGAGRTEIESEKPKSSACSGASWEMGRHGTKAHDCLSRAR